MRLNPQNVQNVVTYNVVIDVSNPEQKLKPGMTANLEITIDERNDVLKVPNAALRFVPQAADGEQATRGGATDRAGQGSRRGAAAAGNTNGATAVDSAPANGAQPEGARERVAPATSPVLEGQTRRVWVLGPDGKAQPRRIKVGLSDGASTVVLEGDLREGETVITGQNVSGTSRPQTGQTAPGFGGAPRTGGAGGAGGGGRRR
jgi:HlyD family secretion protein